MNNSKTKLKKLDFLKKIENYVNKVTVLNEEVTPQTIQNSKYFERIKYFLDKLVQTEGGKNVKTINSIRTAIEKYLTGIKDVSKSSALKSFKSGVNESNRKLSNKDLKYLLEFIHEAEKVDKLKSDKKSDNTKQEKKSDDSKNLEKSKQDKKPEEETVSPSNSVATLLKSSGFSNFVQDASRMSSRRDKAEAYIQMLSALPSISDASIRKAIINKFKTRE